jgi:spore coat polysaccharide biosynthesis protein SpsF (cytidylyltransferase family)
MIVVQARMSSTRRPGKVLADVGGEPMLALMLRRLARLDGDGELVVATSEGADDDAVEAAAAPLADRVHRGSLDDVLDRFLGAVGDHDGPVVRLTADCPLADPAIVAAVIRRFAETPGCGYASNYHPRRFPVGLDVEVCSAAALRAIAAETDDPYDREHVTPALERDPERFKHAALVNPEDLGDLRWTVDHEADLEFVRRVVERLGDRRHVAGMDEILAAVRAAPSLAAFEGRRG